MISEKSSGARLRFGGFGRFVDCGVHAPPGAGRTAQAGGKIPEVEPERVPR